MRRANGKISNSCLRLLLLNLPPLFASGLALDERIKRPRTDGGLI